MRLPNNRLHTDRKTLRSFLASRFAPGEAERYVKKLIQRRFGKNVI